MGNLIFLIVIIAATIIIINLDKIKALIDQEKDLWKSNSGSWPFYAKKALSQPEQILYFRLCKALPENIILAQVQLSRILGVKKGSNYQSWYNRINRMSTDFVVCNKDSSIKAVIELDDSSHQTKDRQAADNKKDKALKSAGIRIIRYSVNNIPDETTIKNYFQE